MILSRIARWCYRHRFTVLTAWAAILVAGVLAAPALFGSLSSDVGEVPDSESTRAAARVADASPTGATIYAVAEGRFSGDPALRREVARVRKELLQVRGVSSVADRWSTGDSRMTSTDGRSAAISVTFEATNSGLAAVDRAADLLRGIDADVTVGGGPLQDEEMETQAADDLARAEKVALPVAFAVLVLLFGGLVAASLPVIAALASVAATLLALLAISTVTDISVYAVNVVTMLGLGLAVDYALLLISRFRGERLRSDDEATAIEATFATAGRTVVFSAMTVAASVAGLLVFPDTFLRSIGAAALSVVVLDMLAALTLLPALLRLTGRRIRPRRPRARPGHAFASIGRAVQSAPVLTTLTVTAVLVLGLLPFLGVKFADADARSLPAASPSRQLAQTIDTDFTTDARTDPITVVMDRTPAGPALDSYIGDLAALSGVRAVTQRADTQGLTVLDVTPTGTSQGDQAMRLVSQIRNLDSPAPAAVTGDAARLADYQSEITARLPWMAGLVATATLLLLFCFTGSVLLPLKALATNLISLGASFGALVWVFQDGHLAGLIGAEALGSLSISTPVLVLAIAFGLSMDYEVFLLASISESYAETGDNNTAVLNGLRRTGGIITAAALLIVIVFAGFIAGGFSPVKQVGLGLALAVILDATLVRLLLVPAIMTLAGRWNWWAPSPLRWLHARVGLSDHPPRRGPAKAAIRRSDTALGRAAAPTMQDPGATTNIAPLNEGHGVAV